MARFQVQLLVFACFGVASSLASFQTDVVAKVNRKSSFPGLPSFLKKARRLEAHEGGEAMAKCMASPCGEKMKAMEAAGEGKVEAMCPLIECLKGEADCAAMLTTMQDDPEMPKGMIGCLCDSGCDLTPMLSGTGDTATMFTTICCMTGADQCTDMLAGGDMAEIGDMGPCICGADKAKLLSFATAMELTGDCKDAPKKAGKDDGNDEVDICALSTTAPDGACAKALMPGWKAINNNADCAKMKESMEKDMVAEETACVKTMEDAVAAAAPAPAEAAADFAQVAAVPPAAGLLLTTAAVAMAAL